MKSLQLFIVTSAMVLVTSLIVACGGDTTPSDNTSKGPRLLPVEPQQVAVNDTLRVTLGVDNPKGAALSLSWTGPALAGLDRCVELSSSPSGGEFVFAPLASHVGEHEFIVKLTSSLGDSSISLRVTVVPGSGAAPVFLRPGSGASFDLNKDPVVAVDVEVRDDDSVDVELAVAQGLPDGAEWIVTGPKSASLEWRPNADQLNASDRWQLVFQASDGQHSPTVHNFLVVLRRSTKEGCPGKAPTVAITSPKKGEKVSAKGGYQILFAAQDDLGLRDAPIVYWTTEEQEDLENPDLSQFQVVPAVEADGGFMARIPTLGLAPGEERVVYVVASATDNDDASGTACDHRTETPVLRFIAVGASSGSGKFEACTMCDYSSDCASGLCAMAIIGGVCVGKCGDAACPTGLACVDLTSVEGAVQQACGELSTVCSTIFPNDPGPGDCAADAFESNESVSAAKSIGKGTIDASLCPQDADFYKVEVPAGTVLTVVMAPGNDKTGDLDLQLRDASGTILAVSGVDGADESVAICTAQPATFIVEVLGYQGGTGDYKLSVTTEAGTCCVDDPGEPDDTEGDARTVDFPGLGEGTICPYNADFFKFTIAAPQKVDIFLAAATGADLELIVYGPGGNIVASGETPGDEEVSWSATSGLHFIRVFGYMGEHGEYLMELEGSGAQQCTDDKGCPLGTVCASGSCADASCTAVSQCPAGYGCPLAGPNADSSFCGGPCTVNSNCRPEEACKYFYEGRYCGLKGAGANGAPCSAFFDCGGQRSCIPWPKGYCARDNCKSALDCEPGTFCVPLEGVGACVVDCWASDSICRLSDGYMCDYIPDITGESQFVCVP